MQISVLLVFVGKCFASGVLRGDVSALVMWVLDELPLESKQPTHSHALHSISQAPDILLHYTTPLIYMRSETGSAQAPYWTPTEQK